jgi:hypothetical protein
MSNRNISAFPLTRQNACETAQYGLTKREFTALEILKSLTRTTPNGFLPSVDDAVRLADRLFDKLEETVK